MIDEVVSIPRTAVNAEIGECDAGEIASVDQGLRRWFALD